MEPEDQYTRVIRLLEKIDGTLCEIKGILDKYLPAFEKWYKRINVKWGQRA